MLSGMTSNTYAANTIRGWSRRASSKLRPLYDEDDLRQEGELVWHRVRTRYAALDERQQITSLKVALGHRYTDLLRESSVRPISVEVEEPYVGSSTDSNLMRFEIEDLRAQAPGWLPALLKLAESGTGRQKHSLQSDAYLEKVTGASPDYVREWLSTNLSALSN